MKLKDLLTIVIPCKDENENIKNILSDINNQNESSGLNVIVADASEDYTTQHYIWSETGKTANIKVIEGGYPAKARYNGANLTNTQYILFLDADMRIQNKNFLLEILNEIIEKDSDLLTCKVRTYDNRFNYVYKFFDVVQKLHIITGPFALGGIMLFKKSSYDKVGGFNPNDLFAEDYNLSRKINSNKFLISKQTIFTSSRRIEKKGISYMLSMLVKSYFNRNNRKFFEKHHNYWL